MPFENANALIRTIIEIMYFTALVLSMIGILLSLTERKRHLSFFLNLILFLFSLLILSSLVSGRRDDIPLCIFLYRSNVLFHFLIPTLSIILSLLLLGHLIKARKDHLSKMSLKESFDHLPIGICIYEKNGLPRLVNHAMQDISLSLTDENLLNGEKFYSEIERLSLEQNPQFLADIPGPILEIDHRIYSFCKETFHLNRKEYKEIILTEITRQHELSLKLEKANQELTAYNRRLKEYGDRIEELTIRQETLSFKIKVHDRLGQLLIQTESMLNKNLTEEEKESLLSLWKKDLFAFESMEEKEANDTYRELMKAMDNIGVTVRIQGERPTNRLGRRILVQALVECGTNCVKHAKGNRVNATVSSYHGYTIVAIENNGLPPEKEIEEKGGLASLRTLVEKEGGTMDIESFPKFRLRISYPEEENG